MQCERRRFLELIPVTAISGWALAPGRTAVAQTAGAGAAANAAKEDAGPAKPLITSPPVVQHPSPTGFTVAFAVSQFATGWVQWGESADRLDQTVRASRGGLICASDRALSVSVPLPPSKTARTIYYRIVAQPLSYHNAYQLQRGEEVASEVFALRLPGEQMEAVTLAIVNDTHQQATTIAALHQRIADLNPDLLAWNGDTCNDFDANDDPMQIVLNPAGDTSAGWASGRPLLFVPGNHDVRGARARELADGLVGWPGQHDLPYNFAIRVGELAIIGLDTGEDKPDNHPVFAGTAAFEPYREAQRLWLEQALQRPEIASARHRIAICHIPLRGLPDQNDGMSLEGYAAFSGFGAKAWLSQLTSRGVQAVISGHTHRHRVDAATAELPIMQVVGGGPQPNRATLTVVRCEGERLQLWVEDLNGQRLFEHSF